MKQMESDNMNKKLFNLTLCNSMKIGQNVGILGYQCKSKVGTERVKHA